jgi:hypothetical protein
VAVGAGVGKDGSMGGLQFRTWFGAESVDQVTSYAGEDVEGFSAAPGRVQRAHERGGQRLDVWIRCGQLGERVDSRDRIAEIGFGVRPGHDGVQVPM